MATPDRPSRFSAGRTGTPGSGSSAGSGYGGRVAAGRSGYGGRISLQPTCSPPGGIVRAADDDNYDSSPRDGVHGRRRLSRDPNSPQEKAGRRSQNVRWMREWQPVDPRMASVFLSWKRDIWGQRCIVSHLVRTYRNARMRNAMYHVMQQWRHANAKRALVQRTLFKLLNRKAVAALNAWSDMVAESRERRVKVARALMRSIHKALVQAFERWSAQIKDSRRKMVAVGRSLRRMLNRSLARSLEGWCEYMRAQNRARKTIRILLNRRVSLAFNAWLEFLVALEEQQTLMYRVVRKISHGTMSAALTKWKFEIDDKNRKRRVVARAINKIFNRGLAMAIQTWNAWTKSKQRDRGVLNRAFQRMFQRSLSMAFEGWLEGKHQVSHSLRIHHVHFYRPCKSLSIHDPSIALIFNFCCGCRVGDDRGAAGAYVTGGVHMAASDGYGDICAKI